MFGINTDGNLAALNAHIREQDRLEGEELALESEQQELSDDLFDAYIMGNDAVIDEVNDALTDSQTTDNLIDQMRYAMAKECTKPVSKRGADTYDAYMKIIAAVCDDIAERADSMAKIGRIRREWYV